jgi:extracellular factor (EF) 3-hydroxypalmitic acid methyl ester biosynthesis protein
MATGVGGLELENTVVSESGPDGAFQGRLVRLTRHVAVFELYDSAPPIRLSENINDLTVYSADRRAYHGRGTVTSLVDAGACLMCEVQLDPQLFTVEFLAALSDGTSYANSFLDFMEHWRQDTCLTPEFKVVITDLVSFLTELHRWTDQMEMAATSPTSTPTSSWRQQVVQNIAPQAIAALNELFGRFETLVAKLEPESLPVHRRYTQQRLHPWVLTAPFAHRTYTKPLGYAGDYVMVNMMLEDPYEGSSLFAQLFNTWLLQQASAIAHRTRIEILTRKLLTTAAAATREGRRAQVYNLGCGPAREVFGFLAQSQISSQVDFVLVDMDTEALEFARQSLQGQAARHGRSPSFTFLKKSMRDILRDAATGRRLASHFDFDLVYCAGLFDYLSAPTCRQFIDLGYRSLRPRGTFLCSNVSPQNPNQGSMELILDWHLLHRDTAALLELIPKHLTAAEARVTTEDTGTNFLLELTKPHG